MRKICYTCITGNYDNVKELTHKEDDWDYILFTNNKKLTSNTWKVIYIHNPIKLDNVRLARYVKINYHHFLPHHDINVWIDGNVEIINNLNAFVNNIIDDKHLIYLTKHPLRNCVYAEAEECIIRKKDFIHMIKNQITLYHNHNIPINIGMSETNVIIRKNTEITQKFMSDWLYYILTYSKRDQLSFDVVNLNYKIVKKFSNEYRLNSFKWNCGHIIQ